MSSRRKPKRNLFLRLYIELSPYRRLLVGAMVATVTVAGLNLIPPQILSVLIDRLYARRQISLPAIFVLFVTVAVASGLVGYALTMTITRLGQSFVHDARRKLYSHLQSLPLGYFEKNQTGKIMSSIINDVSTVNNLVTGGLVQIISDFMTLIAVMALVFWRNSTLAMWALSVYPIYVLNYLLFIGRIKRNSESLREVRDDWLGDMQEKLAGVQVVKSYAKERWEVKQFVGETRSLLTLNIRQGLLGTGLWTIAEFLGMGIGAGLILLIGGRLVIRGELSPGGLFAFLAYITGYLYSPTVRLLQMNDMMARARAALNRIFAVLDTQPDIVDNPDALPMPIIRGDVEFSNVWFEYEPGQPVLKGIDLSVQAGMMVAVVGFSGSGKTTLMNLLMRHYDPTDGVVRVDGYNLREVQVKGFRSQVGSVLQETVLFNTTILENIRYGRMDATEEQAMAAAQAANVHHVVDALPGGYATRIGEDGIKLSVGEKQRIAIARALLADPKILILDEATSSLDSQTEALVQEALDHLLRGRTSFVIAHRLSTIVKADIIVVMEDGIVMESGTHQELLARDGVYAGLYRQQFAVALADDDGDAGQPATASGS